MMAKYVKLSTIAKHVTPHVLRHSTAAWNQSTLQLSNANDRSRVTGAANDNLEGILRHAACPSNRGGDRRW
jgi:hypothetical protein